MFQNPKLDKFDTQFEIHECIAGEEYFMIPDKGMRDQKQESIIRLLVL